MNKTRKSKEYSYEEGKRVDQVLSILDGIFQVKENGIVQCSICGGTTIGRPHNLWEIHHLEKFPYNNPDFPYGQDLEALTTEKINRHRKEAIQIYFILQACDPGRIWDLHERKQSYLDSFDEVEK